MMEAAAGAIAAVIVAALWFWFRVGKPPTVAARTPPLSNDSAKAAREAIAGEARAVTAAIAADLESSDPAGRLADRANRRRRK
tara:strand:- start:454 stop:702 length:249 start_codon:yes stop_codon:yes gene_type:complete